MLNVQKEKNTYGKIYVRNLMAYLYFAATLFVVYSIIREIPNLPGIVTGILFGALHAVAYYATQNRIIRYFATGVALLLFVLVIAVSNVDMGNIFHLIFLVPVLYAFLLPDLFSGTISGMLLAWVFLSYSNTGLPQEIIRDLAIGTLFYSVSITTIIRLVKNFIRQYNGDYGIVLSVKRIIH